LIGQEERLYELRELFLKPLKQGSWRVRRDQQIGFTRWRIVETILQAGRPLNIYQISFALQRSVSSARSHLRVLENNRVLCANLTPQGEDDRTVYYAACPVCPLAEECLDRLQFWKKSGLMEGGVQEEG